MECEYEPITGQPLRDAHKMNYLVDQGKVSPAEASEASRREVDQMITAMFDKKFTQNFFRPWEMEEKSMGQKAEDLLIDLLNHLPGLHVRHATDREDQVGKMDMALTVDGTETEIPIQLATFTDPEKLDAKRKKTPPKILLVAVPMADIFVAYEQHDEQRLRNVIQAFVRQVLDGLRSLKEYLPIYGELQTQLAAIAA